MDPRRGLLRIRFDHDDLRRIADGSEFPGALPHGVARDVQSMIVWLEEAVSIKDVERLSHVYFDGQSGEGVLRLADGFGLSYTLKALD